MIPRLSSFSAPAIAILLAFPVVGDACADTILIDDDFETGTFESWTPADLATVYDDAVEGTDWSTSSTHAIRLQSRPGGSITLADPLPLATRGFTSVTISYNLKFESPSSTRRTYVAYAADGENFVDLGFVTRFEGPVSYTLTVGMSTGGYEGEPLTDEAKFQIRFYDSGGAPRAYVDDVVISAAPDSTGSDSFSITQIEYMSADDVVTLTWESTQEGMYRVDVSRDLSEWEEDFSDPVGGDAGDQTTRPFDLSGTIFAGSGRLFFRVERLPGPDAR